MLANAAQTKFETEISITKDKRGNMSLKKVGFFKELGLSGKHGPSLKDYISDTPHTYEKKIVHYLQNGHALIGSPGVTRDVLSHHPNPIGDPSLITDGVWLWRADLEYYVRAYHCQLPEAFIQHMQAQNWQVPPETEIDFHELELRLLREEQNGQ